MSFFYYDGFHDRLNKIKSLIMRSTMVDPLNKEGMSSLHFAIICGRSDLTDQFVREGADVNEQDREGMCPLHIAVACGHPDIIDYLVANEANVNEQNKEGLSPLHIAVIHGHLDSVQYLTKKGADINLKDTCGISPLFYALTVTIDRPDISFHLIKYYSSLAQGVNAESVFNDLLHTHDPNLICYPEAQALDLKVQSHKRHQKRSAYFSKSNKKRKLEDVSATSKKNTSNIQFFQGSQNPPSDTSIRFKSTVNTNSEMPACSVCNVDIESVNNKNLKR